MQADGEVALVGSGLAALTAYATLRNAGLPPGAIAVFGPRRRSSGALAPARSVHPAAQDALRERRAPVADVVPGPGGSRRRRESLTAAAPAHAHRQLPPERRGIPHPRRRGARADALGRAACTVPTSSRCVQRRAASRSTATAASAMSCWRWATRACPYRRSSRATPRRARLRAARVRRPGDGRRRRHGGGDRVAQRPRRRSRGHLGAPRGSAAAAAEPAAATTSRSAAWPASAHCRPRRRAEALAGFSAPSYPPGRAWDEPIALAEQERRSLPGGAER